MKNVNQTVPGGKKIGVCMVTGAFYPEIAGGTLQCYSLMQRLKDKVNFYVIATYKPSSEKKQARSLFTKEVIGNMKIYRIYVERGNIISEVRSAFALIFIFCKIAKNINIFHIHSFTRKNYLITFLAKLAGKKTMVKPSSFGVDDPVSIKKRFAMVSKIYSLIDSFIAISPAIEKSHKIFGIPDCKIHAIPNGVDTKRFRIPDKHEKEELRKVLGIPESSDVILSVGFFSRDKGLDLFSQSLVSLPHDKLEKLFLIFVGSRNTDGLEVDDDVVKKVGYDIKKLNLEKRTLFVEETHEIEKYFKASDIFILPSKREGLPNALLEAMACGLHCIVNRIEGITDYVIDNRKSGYLLDSLNPEHIAKILTEALDSKNKDDRIGKNARQKIEQSFNLDKIEDSYFALYSDLIKEEKKICAA